MFLHWLHYYRARFRLTLHREDDAIAAYRDALAIDPQFTLAAAGIAMIEASRQRWEASAQALQQVLQITPDDADIWFNLGYVRQQQNDDAGAIDCFERAVALKRSLDRAWFGMGLSHRKRGDTEKAIAAFKVAAELQPMNPHAFYELAMAQLTLSNLDEVHKIIRHVSGFDPKMTRQLVRETGQHPEGVILR